MIVMKTDGGAVATGRHWFAPGNLDRLGVSTRMLLCAAQTNTFINGKFAT